MMAEDSSGGLDNCIKLLKGNSDEQRLVGLLVATKYVQGNDKDSILQVYNAIGIQFINRLLKSGVKVTSGGPIDQEEPYTRLGIIVLSAFCKVPELASLDEIIDNVPTVLDILRKKPTSTILSDTLECLLGIGSASEKGLLCLQKARAFPLILECLSQSMKESTSFRSSIKIIQLLLSGSMLDKEIMEYATNIVSTIPVLAEAFSSEQSSFKMDILLLLRTLCSPKVLVRTPLPKEGNSEEVWLKFVRSGVGQVLQGQVALEQKYSALELTAFMIDMFGTSWILGPMVLPGENKGLPLDRFFLLLAETLRVETIVLLNEVARSLFDQEHATTSKSQQSGKKNELLATCYVLLESVISITVEEEDDNRLTDHVLKQTVSILNEVINTVVEFLTEAENQRMREGDILLASARLVGRYLADAPSFQKELSTKFLSMLEYLFTISLEHEESPFLVIQFLLPALCQLTMDQKGCKAVVSWGGHKQVISFMLKAIQTGSSLSLIIKAGDVILNLLQKDLRLDEYIAFVDFIPLLTVLPTWAGSVGERIGFSLGGCICAMILDLSNEDEVLRRTSDEVLSRVYAPIVQTLKHLAKMETPTGLDDEQDLWELTLSACVDLVDRYPSLKQGIKSSSIVVKPSDSSSHLLLASLLAD